MTSYLTSEILNLSRHPRHSYKIEKPTHFASQENILCGDNISIQLVVENNKVIKAAFTGNGCALTIASASKLIDSILNLNINKINLNEENWLHEFSPNIPPARQKCVTLAIAVLKSALAC
jgi:nitrogen fixation NifU-like protein